MKSLREYNQNSNCNIYKVKNQNLKMNYHSKLIFTKKLKTFKMNFLVKQRIKMMKLKSCILIKKSIFNYKRRQSKNRKKLKNQNKKSLS